MATTAPRGDLPTPRTTVHGLPRIGPRRELKWALEAHWAGERPADELLATASELRRRNWETAAAAGIDLVPSNDFSLYDHVLDTAVMVGAVPHRFGRPPVDLETYFAMARGVAGEGRAVAPLELTKWFDTNYHHLVPELGPRTSFALDARKPVAELEEAAAVGVATKPVVLGPLSFLLLARPEEPGFDPLRLLDPLVEVYAELLAVLAGRGARWVQLDEPVLCADRSEEELAAAVRAYRHLGAARPRPRLCLSTYFGHVGPALPLLADLPVDAIGLDFCDGGENLELLRRRGGLPDHTLFAGVVHGRQVWAADLARTLDVLDELAGLSGGLVVSSSCSLLHVPCSLRAETDLDPDLRSWLAFAEEKLAEVALLGRALHEGREAVADALRANAVALASRRGSPRVRDAAVRARLEQLAAAEPRRPGTPGSRQEAQARRLRLPLVPTTTIGSFPQTAELRAARAALRSGALDGEGYRDRIRAEIDRVVALQEELGLDVLVHGEPERDDMVRYFAERLGGFALTEQGWVQSYGSRLVRPPLLYGDVSRPGPLSLEWTLYAKSRTGRPVKAILTGPVTMLQWSYVRDDQPRPDTALQLAVALADEVADLEAAGVAVVQVDEPGLREGLPLRRAERDAYLAWATRAFRVAVAPAGEATQVHTHMCYAELTDILGVLSDLDVDVVSLEAARSQMALLADLASSSYEGGVGPGVYDVHSPRVPTVEELVALLRKAAEAVGANRLWANPDCGLKTRRYEEAVPALRNLVAAARQLRAELGG
jgi:5-methyltetrahydropteroyltriglutamate--homocysteine methyltransferase